MKNSTENRRVGPIFIVGNSRSGTTLLARILSKHSLVHILNETHFMDEYAGQRNHYDDLSYLQKKELVSCLMTVEHKGIYRKNEYEFYPEAVEQVLSAPKAQKEFSALIAAFFSFISGGKGKNLMGDQTPGHVFHIGEIQEMFPDAIFINMVRDPRAVLLSQKNKWKAAQNKLLPVHEIVRSFFNYHPLTTSFLWKKGVEAGLKGKQIISEKIHILQFEELVNTPLLSVKKVCDFLWIDFEPNMLDVQVSMTSNLDDEGKDGICKEVASRWQSKLSMTEVMICERVNGRLAKQLGYGSVRPSFNLLCVLLWLLYLPMHLGVAFLLNLGRMGNPISYIMKKVKVGDKEYVSSKE